MRADGRTGPSGSEPAEGDTEAKADREPAGESRSEVLTRYEQALTRVEDLQRGLRQVDPSLAEPADLRAEPRPDPSPSTSRQGAPSPTTGRKTPAPPERKMSGAPTGAGPVRPSRAPRAGAAPERADGQGRGVSRSRRWQWAAVAGATLVVAAIAVGALWPAPRPGGARQAAPSEGRPSAERVSSRPSANAAVEERAAEETPQPASQPEEQTPEPTLVRHVNREGGYSFRYPDSWTLDETGEVTTVSSTDGRYVVSFALGPEGTLGETYESFVGLLERSYREVAVTRRDNVSLSGGSGLLVGGQAVNSSGTHVAFRAVLLPTAPQSVVRSGGARPESPTIGAIAATDSAASFDQRLTDVLTSVEAR